MESPRNGEYSESGIFLWWVVVQLSGLARANFSVRQIETAVTSVLRQDPISIYIPVIEDFYGKQDSGYGEYIFINYISSTDYYILENEEAFTRVLKEPHSNNPYVIDDYQLEDIRNKVHQEVKIQVDDVVKLIRGNLRGNHGVVKFVGEDSVSLSVQVGQESLESVVSLHDVRRSKRKTMIRQKELEVHFKKQNGVASCHGFDFGDVPSIYILKEGLKHTRIMINNKVQMLPNEEVAELLKWIEDQSRS